MSIFTPGEELVIEPPVVTRDPDGRPGLLVEIPLRQGACEESVHFRISGQSVSEPESAIEAGLAVALIPAMKLGAPLVLRGAVDRGLLERTTRFQEIFVSWFPEFSRVPLTPDSVVDRPSSITQESGRRGVGLFFSGGVDSTYSLLQCRDELTHAIFIHGCDIPLGDQAYRERASKRLGETVDACGLRLIEVETNVQTFGDAFAEWGLHYHGCGLAAIAILLGGCLRKVFVASTFTYRALKPWGSSALTDPLWSTPEMQIVNQGGEHGRFGKLQVIARDEPNLLRNLRVCFETPEDGYNCGRCEKCIRNMVILRILGVLDRCPVFDHPLDPGALPEMRELVEEVRHLESWRIVLGEAERRGTDTELIDALRELDRRTAHADLVREFVERTDAIVVSAPWRAALSKFRTPLLDSLRTEAPDWFAGRVVKWLPAMREEAFERLWRHDRRWFRRSFRRARRQRLAERWRSLLARLRKPPP